MVRGRQISWGVAVLLSLPFVFAWQLPGIVGDVFKSIFLNVPETYVLKSIYAIMVFSLLYFVASMLFKNQKGVATTISLGIAFGSAVLLPDDFLNLIFSTYTIVIGILMVLAPVVGFLWLAHNLKTWIKGHPAMVNGMLAIAYFLAAYILGMMSGMMDQLEKLIPGFKDMSISGIISIIVVVFIILGFWHIIKMFANRQRSSGSFDAVDVPKSSDDRKLESEIKDTERKEEDVKTEEKTEERQEEQVSRDMEKNLNMLKKDVDTYKKSQTRPSMQILNNTMQKIRKDEEIESLIEKDETLKQQKMQELTGFANAETKQLLADKDNTLLFQRKIIAYIMYKLEDVFNSEQKDVQKKQKDLDEIKGYIDKALKLEKHILDIIKKEQKKTK
ncbi:MAG: hypothetical protein V1725_03185 [archaeon]